MTTTNINHAIQKAKSAISVRIEHSINDARMSNPKLGNFETADIKALSHIFLDRILEDKAALANLRFLLAETDGSSAIQAATKPKVKTDEWLKTQEAAKRMGFSRPYLTALIDAGEFGEGSIRNPSGHRRVKASAIIKWMSNHGLSHPLNEEHKAFLSAEQDAEFFEKPGAISRQEKSNLMKIIQKNKAESLKYKPTQK